MPFTAFLAHDFFRVSHLTSQVPEAISSLTSLGSLDLSFTPIQQIVPRDCAKGKELQLPWLPTNTSGTAQPLGTGLGKEPAFGNLVDFQRVKAR